MKIQSSYFLFFHIFCLLLFFSSTSLGQSKGKKKPSNEKNSISVAYGKRIDSFALKGNLFSMEIGFIKKRKIPFYIELNYFQRQHEVIEEMLYNGRVYLRSGFTEKTQAIETRFKLHKNLIKWNACELVLMPFGSLSYQLYQNQPVVQNEYGFEQHDASIGLGCELKLSFKLANNLYIETGIDYTLLRGGYANLYIDNPLQLQWDRSHKSFVVNLLDPYFIGKGGLKFLLK